MKKLILLISVLSLVGCAETTVPEKELKSRAVDVTNKYTLPEALSNCNVYNVANNEYIYDTYDLKAIVCDGKIKAVNHRIPANISTRARVILLDGVEYEMREKK